MEKQNIGGDYDKNILYPIDANDTNAIKCILELDAKVFGEGFTSKEELLEQILLCQNTQINNAICIKNNGKIIGFGLCYIAGKWSKDNIQIDESIQKISKIGYIKTIIIDPKYQGQGLADKIFKEILYNAKQIGEEYLLLHAWDGSPNNSSVRFFQKAGAKEIKTYNKKWYQDSLENGWKCSKCGNPCVCSSIEMIIKI